MEQAPAPPEAPAASPEPAEKRPWYKPRMPWREARAAAKQEWQDAERLDRRGLLLGHRLFFLIFLSFALILYWQRGTGSLSLFVNLGIGAVGAGLFLAYPFLIRLATYWFSVSLAAALVFAFFVVYPVAFAVAMGTGEDAVAYVFAVAFAILLIGSVASGGSGAYAFTYAAAVAVAFAGAFAFPIAVTDADAVVGAVVVAFVLAFAGAVVVESATKRAYAAQLRVDSIEKPAASQSPSPFPELSRERATCVERCKTLMDGPPPHLTIGFAGRRGLGKTNLLRLLLDGYATPREEDPKEAGRVHENRIRAIELFVHAPADFGEMTFLSALLERLALEVNRVLVALLPAFKPYPVERALQEKRRLLRTVHLGYGVVALVVLSATGWVYWQSGPPDPFLGAGRSSQTASSDAAQERAPSRLYRAMADSLSEAVEPRLRALEDSLRPIDALLNPDVFPASWNFKGKWYDGLFGGDFLLEATWDSLQRTPWPQAQALDSLRSLVAPLQQRLDSIAAVEQRHAALQDSLRSIRRTLAAASDAAATSETSWWSALPFYFLLLLFPLVFGWTWYATREGAHTLKRVEYDVLRNEIALYERTNELLEQLKYHLTFGEGQEASAAFVPFKWFSLSGRRSRQLTRALRPFTVLSLVDEYRRYVQEIGFYLNRALGDDKPVKIFIAIDELDKVLDTQRLHEMLKSIKAVFELENVYYLLSISEDALGTYRLRHIETKNEIDSAFTHIFSVPPMNAAASLAFFQTERKDRWPADLLAPAIVFGGGVPRDMHRLSQLLAIRPERQPALECLSALYREDLDAAIDLIQQNPSLSDEWRHRWITDLSEPWPSSISEADYRLKRLEDLSLDDFERENPCSGDAAKRTFHQMRSLLHAMVIKSYLYHRLSLLPTPPSLKDGPENPATRSEVRTWLDQLEPLRGAIFGLAANPLGVWEKVKAADEQALPEGSNDAPDAQPAPQGADGEATETG